MKTRAKLMILVGVVIVNVGCTDNPQFAANTGTDSTGDISDDKNLLGSWSRSFEEEQRGSGVEVFRPSESREFPLAWYRMRYVLNEDHSCEWLVLDPLDAHFMTSGRWDADPQDKTVILVYDADGAVVESVSFRVVELTADILRIKRMSN